MAAAVACRHRLATGVSRFWMSFKALCLPSSCRVSTDHAQSPSQQPQLDLSLQEEHSLEGQQHPQPAVSLP